MSSSAPPCFTETPWGANEALRDVAARYEAFNDTLADRLGVARPKRRPKIAIEVDLRDVAARYGAFNARLARRLADIPDPPKLDANLDGNTAAVKTPYFIECSVCGKKGPEDETIFSSTMAAQRAGFTYDSATLKVGSKVRWFCPSHREKKS